MKITIGARKSSLALVQCKFVAQLLEAAGAQVELCPIKTVGDTLDVALAEAGDKGVFVREIDEALAAGDIDAAVHNMKDIAAVLPRGISIAAVPAREDARDAFVSTRAQKLAGLPRGAKIGTSSPRRRAQLFRLRPDLDIVPLKGNIEARLKKLHAGKVDAIILAAADLKRLGIGNVITECLPVEKMVPAVGQGALAVEVRSANRELIRFVQKACHHKASGITVRAERSFLKAIGGDPATPVGAYAEIKPNGLELVAFVATPDEAHSAVDKIVGNVDEAVALGERLAEKMLAKLQAKES